jgi:predicted NBD/HSP70 family sugar kinase
MTMKLIKPNFIPPLDEGFRPAILANQAFRRDVKASGHGEEVVIGLERTDGSISHYETVIFSDDHPRAQENLMYIERIVKFLLWQRGGWKVYIGGSHKIGEHIQKVYTADGARAFDYQFMGEKIFQRPFTVTLCDVEDVPAEREVEMSLGRQLTGNRIGFDLGASDLKVAAVIDGEAIFSSEMEWEPSIQSDPNYHYEKISTALKLAASKLPSVDAIGGSAAGNYANNRALVASLYRGIPEERFDEIREMFIRIGKEFGVPLDIINDGEVTALAGSMSLGVNGILGIALGSSEAGGYVTSKGNITNWLNELAFCPIDYSSEAPIDEWSGDRGCGALYFSQQCVFRLAPIVDIDIPQDLTNAQKLKGVQEKLESGHEGAGQIWQSMGYYMGYAIAHYADFYELENVLILGRCTSGKGGTLILDGANQVLAADFPKLATKIEIKLPDEKSRRVGQSIAAASLPIIDQAS